MAEDVLNPEYWNGRLSTVTNTGAHLHQSVFRCPLDRWQEIEEKHKKILQQHMGARTSVLDVGCGYGRLLTLMPDGWQGNYLGVDICPAFIEMAREEHNQVALPLGDRPYRMFQCGSAETLELPEGYQFNLAVLVSVRPMLIRNAGAEYWERVEKQIRRYATNLLYLEYDPLDNGSLE